MKRRKRLEQLSFEERLRLLRKGLLSDKEVADLAADLGSGNYIEAREDVEILLNHRSAIVRYNALATLAYEWGVASNIDRIIEMLHNDPDEECRGQAVSALGSLFSGTKDKRVLDLLVGIVKNPRETTDRRAFAYRAALKVIGVPKQVLPNPLALTIGRDELAVLDDYMKAV